jgi:hypothetical protein
VDAGALQFPENLGVQLLKTLLNPSLLVSALLYDDPYFLVIELCPGYASGAPMWPSDVAEV